MKAARVLSSESLAIAIIVVVAMVLRLWNAGSFSFSNDELSALYRLRFDSLQQLFDMGIKVDGHPAGIQLFLYIYTKFAGTSELIVRLPFILINSATCLMIFLLGKKWFSPLTALFAAAAFAALSYPLTYGQLARPYAPGSFFVITTIYFWSVILFENKKGNTAILYMLALALGYTACLYTHYFAGFTVFVAGITGLFFTKRNTLFFYMGAAAISILLFVPHIAISLGHIKLGGVGNWLGKPNFMWIGNYFYDAFNASSLLLIACAASILLGVYRRNRFSKYHIFCIAWFLIVFFTAFLYSLFINPVLQESVLIFVFPLILLVVFSGLGGITQKPLLPSVLFLFAIFFSTVFAKDFYSEYRFANFKGIAQHIQNWQSVYGKEQLKIISAINEEWYLQFYLDNPDRTTKIVAINNHPAELLPGLISDSLPPMAVFARLKPASPHSSAFLKAIYPRLIEKHEFGEHSEILLLSKENISPIYKDIITLTDITERHITMNKEFSDGFEFDGKTIAELNPSEICFRSSFKKQNKADNIHIVIHITYTNEDYNIYEAVELSLFQVSSEWNKAFVSVSLPDNKHEIIALKTYIWNPELKNIFIDDIEVMFFN